MGQLIEFERSYILQDDDFIDKLELQHFDPAYWSENPSTSTVFGGRGGSIKIEINGQCAILRRYLRGGRVARLSTDRYLWPGKTRTRAWKEWGILNLAIKAGMRLPRPRGVSALRPDRPRIPWPWPAPRTAEASRHRKRLLILVS